MGREDGFAIADVAVGLFDDDKVRKLWRRLEPDSRAMCEAMVVFQSVVLASWGAGRRKTVDESAPLWLSIAEETVPHLVAVGLLDRSGKVPKKSWDAFYGPAAARRAARVESGRLGGKAKAERAASDARATLYPSGRQAGPSVPSLPDRPPRARTASKAGARGPTNLREAVAGTSFAAEHGLDAKEGAG